MVNPFLVNFPDATHAEQSEPFAADIEVLLRGYQRTGVISGCAVTAQGSPNMTLAVSAGTAIINGVEVAVSSGNVTITTADATNPRIDVVHVNGSGTKAVTAGTAATSPVAPDAPADTAVLARVFVPANDTAIADNQINDQRIFIDRIETGRTAYMVAANDSPVAFKVQADFLCDGTADEVEIQAALDALPSTRGGRVHLAPGTYNLAAGVEETRNAVFDIVGPGTKWLLAPGVTGLTIHQGSTAGLIRGVGLEGVVIDGQNDADTIGLILVDTNYPRLIDVDIENCGRGIVEWCMDADEFVEGVTMDDVLIRNCPIGIEFRRTGGTNSFGQHRYRGVNINVSGTGGIGVLVPTGCSLYRSSMEIGVWVATDDTGFSFDGDFAQAELHLFVEGSTGSTGNTAFTIGTNATGLDTCNNWWSFWGTIETTISNAFSKNFSYMQGRRFIGVTNAAPVMVFRHGAAGAYVTLEHQGAGGGRVRLGSGTGTIDVGVQRSSSTSPTLQMTPHGFTLGGFLRSGLPAASNVPEGTAAYVTDEDVQVVSDGTSWKVATPRTVEVAGNITLTATDSRRVVNVDSAGGARAVTLPDNAAANGIGFFIRRDGGNDVTINRAGTDTFDDASTSKVLGSDGASIGIFSVGGGDWKIVGTNGTVT